MANGSRTTLSWAVGCCLVWPNHYKNQHASMALGLYGIFVPWNSCWLWSACWCFDENAPNRIVTDYIFTIMLSRIYGIIQAHYSILYVCLSWKPFWPVIHIIAKVIQWNAQCGQCCGMTCLVYHQLRIALESVSCIPVFARWESVFKTQ